MTLPVRVAARRGLYTDGRLPLTALCYHEVTCRALLPRPRRRGDTGIMMSYVACQAALCQPVVQ